MRARQKKKKKEDHDANVENGEKRRNRPHTVVLAGTGNTLEYSPYLLSLIVHRTLSADDGADVRVGDGKTGFVTPETVICLTPLCEDVPSTMFSDAFLTPGSSKYNCMQLVAGLCNASVRTEYRGRAGGTGVATTGDIAPGSAAGSA